MEFTVKFNTKDNSPLASISCEMGYDAVIEARKIAPTVKLEHISTQCEYSKNYFNVILTEEQVKQAKCFKTCNFVKVICEKLILQKYIKLFVKLDEIYSDVKVKKIFGGVKEVRKLLSYVHVYYGIDEQRLIKDWIDGGCPCVIGNVDDPFDEIAKEKAAGKIEKIYLETN